MNDTTYKQPPWTLKELSVWAIQTSERMEALEKAVEALQKGLATPPEVPSPSISEADGW